MALIECPECKQAVSDLAPSCPNCGVPIAARPPVPQPALAPRAKKTGCATMGCAILAGLFLLSFVVNLVVNPGSGTGPASRASSATPPVPGSQWSYSRREDAMAKGTIFQAKVISSNTVNFSFPYAGPQKGTLTLRTHPRYGKDVIFSIERGQIPCSSYDGCKVLVRFDDREPVHYSATAPEDNSTETIFIRDSDGFVENMLTATTVRVSANIYQEGSPVFEFDVSKFDQSQYRPKQ